MIIIDIDPVMFRIAGFAITWHGLFTAIGVLIGVILTARLAPRVGLTDEQVYSAAVWVVLGGIVGARLLYVLEHFASFAANPITILAINEGGISIFGALIGGFVAGVIFCIRNRVRVPALADATAPGLLVGLGVGRIGDIINGEHWGAYSTLPWSVRYIHPNTAAERFASVHPTVAYEMLWNLLVAAFLLAVWPRLPRPGMVFLLFAFLYSAGRFGFSFLRLDEARILGGLSVPQVTGLIVMAIGAAVFLNLLREHREAVTEEAGDSPVASLVPAGVQSEQAELTGASRGTGDLEAGTPEEPGQKLEPAESPPAAAATSGAGDAPAGVTAEAGAGSEAGVQAGAGPGAEAENDTRAETEVEVSRDP